MRKNDLGLNRSTQRTRKREFVAQMDRGVPWDDLVALVLPYTPQSVSVSR